MSNYIDKFDHSEDFKDNSNTAIFAIRELDRNGSLVYVENENTGERDWVDYRDVDGWRC